MMKTEMEQFPATNLNPILRVEKYGTVLYSNTAGEYLLNEWGIEVWEKLPSDFKEIVQKVISRNSPERMEVKAGKRTYLIVFHPSIEQECVNIYGFDISDQKELEEKLRESENKYRNSVETTNEGVWIFNAVSETTYVNEKMAEMLGYKPEEMIGRFIWDFADEEIRTFFK
jgi:PAS domain-containing protein